MESFPVQNMLAFIKTKPELVKFVRDFDEPNGFLFSRSPYVNEIDYGVDQDGHSGASLAYCLRACQHILRKQYEPKNPATTTR